MDIYLCEVYYNSEECYEEILINLSGTNVWIGDQGHLKEEIAAYDFTKKWYSEVELKQNTLLTYLGEL